jgi:hypothetical protein
LLGYNISKKYLIRVDGGESVDNRYQSSLINPSDDLSTISVQIDDVLELVQLCVKYNTNRTKINLVDHTLTIFDNDGSTILRTFILRDTHGNPSSSEVAERIPVFSTDGQPIP